MESWFSVPLQALLHPWSSTVQSSNSPRTWKLQSRVEWGLVYFAFPSWSGSPKGYSCAQAAGCPCRVSVDRYRTFSFHSFLPQSSRLWTALPLSTSRPFAIFRSSKARSIKWFLSKCFPHLPTPLPWGEEVWFIPYTVFHVMCKNMHSVKCHKIKIRRRSRFRRKWCLKVVITEWSMLIYTWAINQCSAMD